MAARTTNRMIARAGIGAKITAVVAGLLVVLVVTNLLLLQQLAATASSYDRLLAGEVAQAERSRRLQVEFEQQVQQWQLLLLQRADPVSRRQRTAGLRAGHVAVQRRTDALVADVRDPRAKADLQAFRVRLAALQTGYERALARVGPVLGDAGVRGADRPASALLDRVVDRLQAVVDAGVDEQRAVVAQRERLIVLLGGVAVVVLVLILVAVVVRIVRPIRTLTGAARRVAEHRMPAAVERIATLPDGAAAPRLDAFPVESRDELAELSGALTAMQDAAVGLAVQQRRRERDRCDMILTLGRRNESLLERVLTSVTELERVGRDPDVVRALSRVDRSLTRVRRNTSNLLVLAGAPPTPGRAGQVVIGDVVRAARSQIDDDARVDVYHLDEASVVGSAATDLTHLLAELLENATTFSSPTSRVSIVGQQVGEGYRIRIVDHGIGMTAEELDAANTRILQAPAGPSEPRLLGLHVVGRLAERTGVAVRLEASAVHGLTASVAIPLSCVLVAGRPWSVGPGVDPGFAPAPAPGRSAPMPRTGAAPTVVDVTPYDAAVSGLGGPAVGADEHR